MFILDFSAMKAKSWLICWFIIVIFVLGTIGIMVYKADPFFHYHKPDINKYYYPLDNERSQNDGIIKHFEYDAMITGTSMAENFRTSEMDSVFGCHSVKTAYSGASYREVNDCIKTALVTHPQVKIVIRSLDMLKFFDPYDLMQRDLGDHPTYLYDNNPFNDVNYLFNRDIVFGRTYKMIKDARNGVEPGMTPFDDYATWYEYYDYGIKAVRPEGFTNTDTASEEHLSDDERSMIKANIKMNVTDLADDYPDVDFYYFYTPYSVAWWCDLKNNGSIYKQLEAEKYITELIVPHENIHLFSFNNVIEVTSDLNNYKDPRHYGYWINSMMLKWMHEEKYRLTQDTYDDYCKKEAELYLGFDYESLNGQKDYEADYYAAALMNEVLSGVKPHAVSYGDGIDISTDFEDSKTTIKINLDSGYNYLCFDLLCTNVNGGWAMYVFNEDEKMIDCTEIGQEDMDTGVHQYVLDLSRHRGTVKIVIDGVYCDGPENLESDYQLSNTVLY